MNEYALMSQAPVQPPDFPAALADSAGIPTAICDDVLVAPFNDVDTTTRILEQHHDTLGGVIVEPLQRLVCPQGDFLNRVRERQPSRQAPGIKNKELHRIIANIVG